MRYTMEMIEEYNKCANDIEYFAEKYVRIVHPDQGVIPLKLTDFQREVIKDFQNNHVFAKIANRQCGKTVVACVILLHGAIFESWKTFAIVGHRFHASIDVLEKIVRMYDLLPDFLKPEITESNSSAIHFDNGCSLLAFGEKSKGITGRAVNVVYLDEIEFFQDPRKLLDGIFPTLVCSTFGAKMFAITSTKTQELLRVI